MLKRTDKTCYTGLCGYVTTTYAELVQTFGVPHYRESRAGKVTAEWGFVTDNGVVFTVYDYKMDSTPMGEYDWHIGGNGNDAVDAVKAYFPQAREFNG